MGWEKRREKRNQEEDEGGKKRSSLNPKKGRVTRRCQKQQVGQQHKHLRRPHRTINIYRLQMGQGESLAVAERKCRQ